VTVRLPKAKPLPAELLRVNPINPEAEAMRYAADFLSRGSVIAIPTDTFYGLAADPFNLAAVDEIYHVKGRPEARALPILVNSIDQALTLSRGTPGSFMRLAQNVTGTSANISGFSSCASAAQVMKQLGSRVPLVLDAGETGATLPSTIVELNGDAWKIGREGAVPTAEIEKAMKEK
jgi:L-threonylcarbamoyladenylate synthase